MKTRARIFASLLSCLLVLLVSLLAACQKPDTKSQVSTPVYFSPDPATAATIEGTVRLEGKYPKPTPIDMDQDADCVRLYPNKAKLDESMLVTRDGALANTFVYIKAGLEGKSFATPSNPVSIEQRGCWFSPRVFGIQAGQPFHVINSDPVTHNIHPVAKENPGWNQSQAPAAAPLTRKFPRPEIMVPIKCNVHNWMRAWVGVLPHPYFAVSAGDGGFRIPNLPPGTYTLAAWHEKLGVAEQTVTLGASAQSTIAFTFKGN